MSSKMLITGGDVTRLIDSGTYIKISKDLSELNKKLK